MANARKEILLRFQAPRSRDKFGQFADRYLAEIGNTNLSFINENRALAVEVQAQVVKALEEGIKRPKVSTHRLLRATGDPGNVHADKLTWGVGVPSFLDQSQAKYWRTIDEGSAATWARGGMRGMQVYPWHLKGSMGPLSSRFSAFKAWGGSKAGMYENQWGSALSAGAPWGASGGKLRAITWESGQLWKNFKPITIENEIAAEHYYARGFEAVGGIKKALRVYHNALDEKYRRQLNAP